MTYAVIFPDLWTNVPYEVEVSDMTGHSEEPGTSSASGRF